MHKSGGAGVHQGNQLRTRAVVAIVFAIFAGMASTGAAQSNAGSARSILEPAIWQGPEVSAQPASNQAAPASGSVAPASGDSMHPVLNPLRVSLQPTPPPVPPQSVQAAPAPATPPQPLLPPGQPSEPTLSQPFLDGNLPVEELMPAVVDTGCDEDGGRRGVQPYGGGHPWDWSWGNGGSPYRTGPGMCDNYKVGPRWHVTVDGIVMSREDTDLAALTAAMPTSFPVGGNSGIPTVGAPTLEQFDRGPGGRITFMSQIGRCRGWDMQGAYEGVTEWNASVVYPIQNFDPVFYSPVITTTTTSNVTTTRTTPADPTNGTSTTVTTTTTSTTSTYAPGPLPLQPGAPFPDGLEQRSLKYATQLHSGELNFFRHDKSEWRPYCGVRYIKLDDTISDFFDQEAQFPLPFDGGDPDEGVFLAVAETDRLHNLHIQNNLMGFQIGLLKDTLRVGQRFELEGNVNSGVYYNKVKFSNIQLVSTTQTVADDTATTGTNEARVDTSTAIINDARTYDEISYVAEASVTGVCRLNRCWSLRAGYQVLWITDLQLADSAFTGSENTTDDLLFHGWHAGIECRR